MGPGVLTDLAAGRLEWSPEELLAMANEDE